MPNPDQHPSRLSSSQGAESWSEKKHLNHGVEYLGPMPNPGQLESQPAYHQYRDLAL